MIRLASLFWLALVAVTGFATFKVKYTVQDIEDELNKARRHTIAEQQEIHILRAEWTALNQPERLADLNRRFLSLAAVAPRQMQRKIEDRSEEHTSELQSQSNLVCRLLLEKKKTNKETNSTMDTDTGSPGD